MAKGNETHITSNSISQIAAGTEISGEINCQGDLRIDGNVEGNISVLGKLVVGEKGHIEGEVTCKNCDMSGYLKGRISVQELLSLKATSQLYGDISTKRLSIDAGSVFTGTCQMGGEPLGQQSRSQLGSAK